jgi:hypothetical protein
MNKQRKTSHILNVFQYDADGHVVLPASLTLSIPPASNDDSSKVPTTAWVRALAASLGYVTLSTEQTITGLKTIVRSGDVLNFKIGTDTLYGLKVFYSQNELVESGEATWSFVNSFNRNGVGFETTPLSFFRGVLVTGQRLLSASVNANLLDYYSNNPSGRYPIYAYNTGVQQFALGVIVGETAGVVNAATGAISDLPSGVVANFKGRVIGSNAVNNNEFITLGQLSANNYATQSYVGTQVANLVDAAPGTLDTLNELAAALGDDPNFATTVSTSIGTKVPQARTLTINGTSYDLSADRSWTINSMVYPSAGIALSTGTAWGTSITDNSANWNTAFGWGNHASAGYLTSATAATTYVSLTGSYANPAWITSLAYSKITGVPAFLTSYTETDTLSSVTGRGASTSTDLTFNGTLTMGTSGTQYIRMGRFPASVTNTGEAWIGRASDRSTGTMTIQLGNNAARIFEIVDHAWSTVILDVGMNSFSYKGNTIWHSGNLTNLNQLTNGPGYLTSLPSHNHDGVYMKTNRTLDTINTIDNGGDRYNPSVNNPTNEHYAVLTYGNGGNVTGQLATHFVSGQLYSRGYNSSWSSWSKYVIENSGTWSISISGNAATASAVSWANITAGTRTGHGDLRFQPPASSYAGIQFLDTSGNGAGWFLVRGTSDTDVYTAEGITLVADKGWLTLAQRETAGKGVRIMTGTTSVTRAEFTSAGLINLNATVNLNDNSYFRGSPSYGFRFNNSADSINALIVDNSGNTFAYASHRAPIFYDSNNTAYYVDPASGSRMSNITYDNLYFSGDTTYGFLGRNVYADTVNGRGSDPLELNYYDGGDVHIGAGASKALRAGTVYSTIFYDSNNTAFYYDGASGTNLNYLNVNGTWGSSPFGSSHAQLNINGTYPSITQRQTNGSEGYWLHHVDVSGIYHLYGGRGATNGTDWDWSLRAYPNQDGNRVEFRTDVRAPIFYDSNNTAYYTNPASTSVLNVLAFGTSTNNGRFDGEGTWGVRFRTDSGYIWFGPANTGHAHLYTDRPNFYLNAPLTVNDGSYINTDDIRSAIFYDRNNTGYYVDPTSLSRIANVQADYIGVGQAINTGYRIITSGDYYANAGGNYWAEGRFKQYRGSGTWHDVIDTGNIGSQQVNNLSTNYAGGQQLNPQVYFNNGIGLKVAMTATAGYWSDTLWINGYAGGDVLSMCAMHFQRNGTPRLYISTQQSTSSSYGTLYEIYSSYNMDAPNKSGTSYYQVNTWMQFNGTYGIYWPNHYGAHFSANDISSYTQFTLRGSKNSYGGIHDEYSAVTGFMYDSGGNGGVYRQANGRWYFYYHLSNDCMGVGTSTTSSTYSLYLTKGIYAPSRIDATIYYDASNTGYYLDPNGGSYLAGSLELANGYFLSNGVGGAMYMTAVSGSFGGYLRTSGHMVLDQMNTGYNVYVLDGNSVGVVKNASSQSWSAFSDRTIKTVHSVMVDNLSKLESITPIYYSFNNFADDKNRIGLIAQEVQEQFPELVELEPRTEKLTLDYTGLIPVLLGAIKELKNKVEDLESRL